MEQLFMVINGEIAENISTLSILGKAWRNGYSHSGF
jgi:hypothetical protein